MKTLHLVDETRSKIKYKLTQFPDGQQSIKLIGYEAETIDEWGADMHSRPILIYTRLNNFKDLELLICATKALRHLKVESVHVSIPYFLGSRSDRKFECGSINYLKDVICPIINSLKFESITVLDPHSDVLEACLNNFLKGDNKELVEFAILDIYNTFYVKDMDKKVYENFVLISPDAGASKKIYKLAEAIGYKKELITCEKIRDVDGKLTRTVIPLGMGQDGKDFIIIDDICDGGATFINIAKLLKASYPDNKIYLIVTHGIFSKGFDLLAASFDKIYCTNSYQDLILADTLDRSKGLVYKNLVKQLNVF